MFQSLQQFYSSDMWRSFRRQLIDERTNKADGVLYCQHSGQPLIKQYDIVAHHIKPLTMQNVNDYSISLNPDNILLVSQKAHNEIHARFGYKTERKVYIVYGAPCSGKTTYVKNSKGNSDLVIDIDNIWQCVSGGERYNKPQALKANVFAVRDCMLDMARTRAGNWGRCWIIEGLPIKAVRERKAKEYGAELICIDTDETTCLERLQTDTERQEVLTEWQGYIKDYFASYQE